MDKELHVLIIDDSEADAFLVMRELGRSFSATHERVKNSDELMSALGVRKWDIIICDYIIPGFSAFSALQILKDKKMDIPFIVVSGKVDEEIAVEVMKAGASDYILKDKLGRLVPVIKRELKESEMRILGRKTEEKLENSNERYMDICENANDMIFIAGMEGKFIYANPSFQEKTCYKQEELFEMRVEAVIDAESLSVWHGLTEKILANKKPERVELRLRTKDKSLVYVEGDCGGQKDINGKLVVRGLLRDITERKKSEEMWSKYKAIVNTSSEFMSMINNDYIYEAVNDAYCKAHGEKRENILGRTVSDIWGKDAFVNAIKQNIDKCFEGNIVKYKEWIEFPALGRRYHEVSLYPYIEKSKVINAVIVTRDITELDQTEEKSKQYLDSLSFLSKAAMGFIDIDAESDIYEYIAERLLELIPDSLVIVNAFEKDIAALRIKAILGMKVNLGKAKELVGQNSLNASFAVNKERMKLLSKGRLIKFSKGISELAEGQLAENVCKMVERLLNVESVYTVGFFKQGEMLGSTVIITKEELGQDKKGIIETFANQVSVALLRRSAEEKLKDFTKK